MKKIMIVVGLIMLICGYYLCSWATTNSVPAVSNDVEAAMVTQTSSYYAETYKLFKDQYEKLLWTLAFFITVFGFLMPLVGHFFQRQNLKEERDQMLRAIDQKFAEIKEMQTKIEREEAEIKRIQTKIETEEKALDKVEETVGALKEADNNAKAKIEELNVSIKKNKDMEQRIKLYGGYLFKDLASNSFEANNHLAALSSSLHAILAFGDVKDTSQEKAEKSIEECLKQLGDHERVIQYFFATIPKDDDRRRRLEARVQKVLALDYIKEKDNHKNLLVRIQTILNGGSPAV